MYKTNGTGTQFLNKMKVMVCYARFFGAIKSRALARDFILQKNRAYDALCTFLATPPKLQETGQK